ncbi:glycosyltransferase [Loktanella sp. DJP18]|uniref:glycosyltransferase n=1 Tax=Loktanella sp. DJP18 TaxID=3409788 RepID=UPI003BB6E76B
MIGFGDKTSIGVITIGRNEGVRLLKCLDSLNASDAPFMRIIYVDSGSTDGSVIAALDMHVQVVLLDTAQPFTAARARNAGLAALRDGTAPDLVQFVDGDCVLDPGWIDTADAFLAEHPDVAVVCGRRREMHPEASVYNRLCDAEWNTPVGEARSCGGDALMRWSALEAVGGYDPTLIAGEEPEMCLRMRRAGWKIWRIDAEMTLHDAAMMRFGQFWQRMRRGGHAAAEGAAIYGRDAERHGIAARRRALVWGLLLPLMLLLGAIPFGPWVLWGFMIYPAQIVRLALRDGGTQGAWERAMLMTVGKFAEAQGVAAYHWRRWQGRTGGLIEYK